MLGRFVAKSYHVGAREWEPTALPVERWLRAMGNVALTDIDKTRIRSYGNFTANTLGSPRPVMI
jgi:hypothetical protein